MPEILVKGPDGNVHAYPDGTSDAIIKSDMRSKYGGPGGVAGSGAVAPSKAGQPTALNSQVSSPSMQRYAPYKNDEDWNNIAEAVVLGEKNKGVTQAIQNTPGRLQQVSQAKKTGENLADIEKRQNAGLNLINTLGLLREMHDKTPEEVRRMALGPTSMADVAIKSPLTIPGTNIALPFGEQYTTRDPDTHAPIDEKMSVLKRKFILNPKDEKLRQAYDFQNAMRHLHHVLTENYIGSGGGGSGNMSDARQDVFSHAMGAMLYSTTPEEFSHLVDTAEAGLRNTFNLGRVEQAANNKRERQQPASQSSGPDQLPTITPQAVQELMKDTSLSRRRMFDEAAKQPGAADAVIRSMNARVKRDYGAGYRQAQDNN